MIPHSMPNDLIELENRLRSRADTEPTIDLRDRVMKAVAAELAVPQQTSLAGRWDSRYWAAVAEYGPGDPRALRHYQRRS